MLNKANVLKYINELPEQFSLDELMDKILFLHKIELGLEQSNNDEISSHQQVKDRLKKWLK